MFSGQATESPVGTTLSPGGMLIVGGGFTDAAGSATADHIAGWTGSSWTAIGGGLDDDCSGRMRVSIRPEDP